MKLLTVFLLVGLAFASAVPLFDDDLETELDQIGDEFGDEFIIYSEGAPQHADIKELLIQLRDRIQNHEFDEEKIRSFIEKFVEESEFPNQYIEVFMKMGKRNLINFINRILGENQVAFAPQHADFKELLRQLRDRIQNHEFDEEKIRTFIEKLFGKSEITNQFIEMLKTRGESGKQRLIDFINRILGENQVAFSFVDRLKEHFEQVLENLKRALDDGETADERAWKECQDIYEKLKNLGVKFSKKIQELYEDLKRRIGQNSVQHVEFSIFSRIKERLENLISRMNKDMEDGKGVRGDLMKKLTDTFEKFKGLGGELNQKFKDMLENLRSKIDKSRPLFSPVKHSVKEIYEKKFFLNIELKEKFGEYVKEPQRTRQDIENVKNIAHKFVEDGRKIRPKRPSNSSANTRRTSDTSTEMLWKKSGTSSRKRTENETLH